MFGFMWNRRKTITIPGIDEVFGSVALKGFVVDSNLC